MTRKKIILILGLVFIGVISAYSFVNQKVSSYPDEPKIETKVEGINHQIISTSLWSTPPNPAVISETKPKFDQKSADKVWKSIYSLFPYFKNDLKNFIKSMNISQNYYQYFYMNAYDPLYERTADFNNDGITDTYFQMSNMACAIHCNYIYTVFINNKPYTIKTNKGSLKPRSDKEGFYVVDYLPDPKIPTAPTVTGVILRKFQWNGNGFTEVGEKTMQFIIK